METAGLPSLIAAIVLLSLSGVLMPGPVTAVTLARGAESPHAGAWVAIGHGLIEFPLMALIYLGVGTLFQLTPVKVGIGIAGGLVLALMGISMLRDRGRADEAIKPPARARSPLAAGALLSAGNPYFLIWWATAGAILIQKALGFGAIGLIILAAVHWMCDLVWYYFLSAMAYSGGKFFGRKLQHAVFLICGLALLYFAGFFTASAVLELR